MVFHPLLKNSRILFTIDNCQHCNIYKQFIQKININLNFDKQIDVVDCTKYYEFGIVTDPRIKLFSKHIGGSYPILFFEGRKLSGAQTRAETEARILAMCIGSFKKRYEPENKELDLIGKNLFFDKDCEYHNGRLICTG